ncbi:MAG: PIN domain-containing protein [Candidatus Rokubacteria bacterium]|nr:PIN domain-containing protein [Candidatus Rokubacteria bacterium]
MLNLDTHVLLYALTGELTRREAALLARDAWSISAIVIWEIGKLAELRRIEVDLDDAELVRTLARIHVWPLTLDVCRAIRQLDFRGDPADEIIAATSLVHRVRLVTRDARIRKSRRVPLMR